MAQILIVDADSYLRTLLRVYLFRKGHQITEAASGTEALKLVEVSTPDVILCDLFMPGMSGPETIQALIQKCPGVPVVAMSGEGGFESYPDMAVGASRGVSGSLSKPFSRTSALAAVDQALARPRRRPFEPAGRLFSPVALETGKTWPLRTMAARNALTT